MRITTHCLLYILTWSVIYATHTFVGYYHDDYAYAGLTYFYDVGGPYSERLTLINYLTYLYQHYMGWGGRIIAFGIAIPFMHAGPSIFWFVQSLLVTGILYLGASIATGFTGKKDFPQTLLFLLASYMSMKIGLVRDGLYWGAASVLYVWPMFFLLSAILLMMKKTLRTRDTVFAAIFLFIASASSEPFSLYALSFVGIRLLLNFFQERHRIYQNILWLLVSLCGFLFCFLAPGNFKRALLPGQGIPPLSELIKGIPEGFSWLSMVFPLMYSVPLSYFALLSLCFYVFYTWKNKNKNYLDILPFIAASCAVVCLFILPAARNPRVFMPLILTLPIIAAPFMNVILNKLHSKTISAIVIIIILGYGFTRYIPIWNGYRINYSTIVENDARLSAYKQGDPCITLKPLPKKKYANAMPYDPGMDYIGIFMKQYYDIPLDLPILFNEER